MQETHLAGIMTVHYVPIHILLARSRSNALVQKPTSTAFLVPGNRHGSCVFEDLSASRLVKVNRGWTDRKTGLKMLVVFWSTIFYPDTCYVKYP